MDLGLKGRVALVTGSSQEIGREAAILFAREGARVVITYRTDKDAAERVAATARTSGAEALAHLRANVEGTIAATQAAVASMRKNRWGRIGEIVLSSGGPFVSKADAMPVANDNTTDHGLRAEEPGTPRPRRRSDPRRPRDARRHPLDHGLTRQTL